MADLAPPPPPPSSLAVDTTIPEDGTTTFDGSSPPKPPMQSPGLSSLHSSDSILLKKFGLTTSQLNRAKSLRQLGVTEEDLLIASKLLSQMPNPPMKRGSTKAEVLLGYDQSRLDREKALKRMGVSEQDVDLENTKNLGSLGIEGRKRSIFEPSSGGAGALHAGGRSRSASAPAQYANTPNGSGGKRGSWFSRRGSSNYDDSGDDRSPREGRRGSVLGFIPVPGGWSCRNNDNVVDNNNNNNRRRSSVNSNGQENNNVSGIDMIRQENELETEAEEYDSLRLENLALKVRVAKDEEKIKELEDTVKKLEEKMAKGNPNES